MMIRTEKLSLTPTSCNTQNSDPGSTGSTEQPVGTFNNKESSCCLKKKNADPASLQGSTVESILLVEL